MAGRFAQGGLTASDVVVGINPGSTYGEAKRWLPGTVCRSHGTTLPHDARISWTTSQRGHFGGQGGRAFGPGNCCASVVPILVLSGATTIRELMAAVKRCACSSRMIPVPCISPPRSRYRSWRSSGRPIGAPHHPLGDAHAIVRQPVDCAPCLLRECPIDHRCMTRVTVDQVYEAATKQIWSRLVHLVLSRFNQIDTTHTSSTKRTRGTFSRVSPCFWIEMER